MKIKDNMKDLGLYLNEKLQRTLGFTIDDEIAASYINAFENDDWEHNNFDRDLKDTDLWISLGLDLRKYVLEYSDFTGCLGENTDRLEVYRLEKFDTLFSQACEFVYNGEGGKKPIDEDWGHMVLCYKGHKPFWLTDLNYTDWDEFNYAIKPKAHWRNCVSKTNLEWIIWMDDDTLWIRNKSSYKSLCDYTGWSIWKNGRCEFGKLFDPNI